MSVNRGATFEKRLRDRAKSEVKGLIAVSVDNKYGRWQFWGAIEHELSSKLWRFAHKVYSGKSPREAFDEVWPEGGRQ
jgi:hypothetical protein